MVEKGYRNIIAKAFFLLKNMNTAVEDQVKKFTIKVKNQDE